MRRLPRIALLLLALGVVMPVLAGCSGFDPDSLDPFGFNSKKPLPGKRELLFPNGVPGVTQGIPPQYKEGYQAPAIADLPPGDTDATPPAGQTAAAAPTKPVQESNLGKPAPVHRTVVKRQAAPKHHRVVKRKVKPKPKATATAAEPKGTAAPWPSSTPNAAAAPSGTQAPWPSATPSQSNQAGWPSADDKSTQQKLAPWPSAPPSGTFSKQ